jgi:rsbT co-antagonist protein RsbR
MPDLTEPDRADIDELRAILSAMDHLIFVMNGEGRYLRIVPTRPDLLYKASDDLLGKTLHEVMPKENADFFLGNIRRAIETRSVVTIDYSLPIGGKILWFEARLSFMTEDTILYIARDETARRQAEEALRQSIRQEEIIRAQASALAELSVPLIPITDGILVMPLIGQLDPARMDRATAALLSGIAARRGSVAILDITGVPGVDASVAGGLVRAARAAELLGAEVMLTGVRPEVAQALVALGVDLGGIPMRGTLRDGIASALGLSRRR